MVILPEKVVEQALEALELHMNDEGSILRSRMAWDALRQALEASQQTEPVAYEWRYDSCGLAAVNRLAITETPEPTVFLKNVFARGPFPLYRQQQPVQWVCLTDEEMDGALRRSGVVATFAALRCVGKEVEAKLREKNGGAT